MSISDVRREIRTAVRDHHLTNQEASRIVGAARAHYDHDVAKALVDLFEKAHDGDFTPRPTSTPPTVTTEKGATLKLWGLMLATGTPVGDASHIKQQLIGTMDFGPPRPTTTVPKTDKMFEVHLGAGTRSNGDALSQTAFVDVAKQEAWRRTDFTKADGTTTSRFEGPWAIPQLGGTVSDGVHFAGAPTPTTTPDPVDGFFKQRVQNFWLPQHSTAAGFTRTGPRGRLDESFLLSNAVASDSVVTKAGDTSRFWIKRTTLDDGAVTFKGPFTPADLR